MLVLGINTVADVCEAALVRDGLVVSEVSEAMQQGHDARLAPVVERVMRDAGVALAGVQRVAVIVGPGSFTGVRVGVAFARGLGLSLDIPAVGVSTLEALDALPREGRALGVLPAKRRPPERTWWMQWLADGCGVEEPGEAQEDEIRRMAIEAGLICGQRAGLADLGVQMVETAPTARAAARFATALVGDLPPARPIYVREPDAKPMRTP